MQASMDGQWIGRVEGESPGWGVFELDDFGKDLWAVAYHFPDDASLPSVVVRFRLLSRDAKHSIKGAPLNAIHPDMGLWLGASDVETYFPDSIVASTADVELEFLPDRSVRFTYKTEVSAGGGVLAKSKADQPSEMIPIADVKTWEDFKKAAFSVEPHRWYYRGQGEGRRLRTSFHRTRRKNLAVYRDNDINELRRALSPQLKHVFDQRDADQNGAFYNLLQHHGYPTPLLDWSLSPFVAAYFAFCGSSRGRADDEKVRIFAFDAGTWRTDYTQISVIAFARPHFSIIDLMAIENQRMIPQQAKATLTNVDDIEEYVAMMGRDRGKTYLTAIDLPLSERQQALSELDLMGINEGSLFPGVDGTCKALRYKNFGA